MRMNKGAILASMVVIALASVLAGAGTMAYFSETRSAGITFKAGNPNLKLALDGTGWQDSLTITPPVWAPGDTYAITVWVKNDGDIGLANLYVTGDNLRGPNPNLAKHIFVTDVAYTDTPKYGYTYTTPGHYWVDTGTYYADVNRFGGSDKKLSVTELASGLTDKEYMKFCWGKGVDEDGDYLPVNVVQGFYIEFTFDKDAGDDWQGRSCGFDLVFIGTDVPFDVVWPT